MRMCVFYSGVHTDRFGRSQTWSPERVRAIAQVYNTARTRRAPVVKGHPKLDDPAYGWMNDLEVVEGYPRPGHTALYTTATDLDPQFAEDVRARRYWDRSLAFRTDDTIRHLGFLGAATGALPELGDVEFAEDDGTIILLLPELGDVEFAEGDTTTTSTDEPMALTPEDIQAIADAMIAGMKPMIDDLKTAITGTAPAAEGDGAAELAEIEAENATLRTQLFNQEAEAFLNTPEMRQRIRAGERPGIIETMRDLHGVDTSTPAEIEFAEGGETKKGTRLDRYKAQLRARPRVAPEFGELVTDDQHPPDLNDPVAKANAIVNSSSKNRKKKSAAKA